MNRQIRNSVTTRELIPSAPDNFKDRLIKMIPSEVVAVYMACNTAITEFKGNHTVYWVIFIIIILLMPFYLKRIMQVTDIVQIIIMCVAFALWCSTIQIPFDQLFQYNVNQQRLFSTLSLTLFTFAIPIFYKGT